MSFYGSSGYAGDWYPAQGSNTNHSGFTGSPPKRTISPLRSDVAYATYDPAAPRVGPRPRSPIRQQQQPYCWQPQMQPQCYCPPPACAPQAQAQPQQFQPTIGGGGQWGYNSNAGAFAPQVSYGPPAPASYWPPPQPPSGRVSPVLQEESYYSRVQRTF
eukprot:TRINITY_DN7267_c0_g1_i1.p1 TRINITY_DN7267_c0_g1~~TRINITY_DN7267_c0_g1_i1.p1  ORF type:complete len:159 (+),score=14.90 TRINITY_DN7267_c0_g1_i1:36-512(+)